MCLDKLSGDFSKLLTNGQFSDITIKCNDPNEEGKVVQIPVHKAVLASRSPVFEAMFSYNMSETEKKEVEIIDIGLSTVRDMLTYMYTGMLTLYNYMISYFVKD